MFKFVILSIILNNCLEARQLGNPNRARLFVADALSRRNARYDCI